MTRVTNHVCSSGGVTGRAGNCTRGIFICRPSGSVCSKGGVACCATLDFTTHPSACGFNGFTRPLVLRMIFFKEGKHPFGTVGSPERERFLLLPTRCVG